jgi:NTP pyrophosphatase (non-canonical NTP hydrolase)
MEIASLQKEAAAWCDRNFPDHDDRDHALVVAEECGEFVRAYVKRKQRIRMTSEEWTQQIRIEAADMLIGLLSAADHEGFDLWEVTLERWEVVKQRDWLSKRMPID